MGHPPAVVLAALAGLAVCLPLVLLGSAQAHNQVTWIPRSGLDLSAFSFFGRNLFYSTSVATALIVLSLLAWAAWAIVAGIGLSKLDVRVAAAAIKKGERPGDAVVYQAVQDQVRWLMIGYGVQYYLAQDGARLPRDLFIAKTSAQDHSLYPLACKDPAACLGQPPDRIWVLGSGYLKNPFTALTPAEVTLLRPHYRLSYDKHVRNLTVFLLTRKA